MAVRVTESGRAIPTQDEAYRALRRAWFPVVRSEDLGRAPLAVTLLDEEVVVARRADGGVAIASNHCPHRGAALSLGSVEDGSFVCPYHGWRWRTTDGTCSYIPSLGPEASERAGVVSRAVLRTHHAQERYGLVWCALDDPAVEIPAPDEFQSERWRWGWNPPVTVRAGLRNATENFRDVAHFPFVHRGTMGEVPERVDPLRVRRQGLEVWMERTHRSSGGTADMYDSAETKIEFTYHTFAPAFAMAILDHGPDGHHMVINATSPIGPQECRIFLGAGMRDDYVLGSLEQVIATEFSILSEDVPILNTLNPREAPLDPASQPNTAADRYTLEYRRAFIAFVASANRTE